MDDTLDGVRAWIEAKLEAALVVIEAAHPGTVIPRLGAVDTAEITSRIYPSLEILPDLTTPQYREDEGPLDFEAWDVHSITMWLSMAGTEPKGVEYHLLRYRKAFMRIVRADNTFGGLFNRVRLGDSNYGPMMEDQKTKQLLQVLQQPMVVRVLQR